MARVLFVFVDGIGVGRPGAQNPFDAAPVAVLGSCAGGGRRGDAHVVTATLDATLGYDGLPQSATGQAVLFTGDDAIGVAGGHRSGYPSRAVADLITRRSILFRARQ